LSDDSLPLFVAIDNLPALLLGLRCFTLHIRWLFLVTMVAMMGVGHEPADALVHTARARRRDLHWGLALPFTLDHVRKGQRR
jgi:hypothetical protein